MYLKLFVCNVYYTYYCINYNAYTLSNNYICSYLQSNILECLLFVVIYKVIF